jgi:hypothetical protein
VTSGKKGARTILWAWAERERAGGVILEVPGVFHGVARVDYDLGPFIRVRYEQYLLVQPEVPAAVRIGVGGAETLVEHLPYRGVVG